MYDNGMTPRGPRPGACLRTRGPQMQTTSFLLLKEILMYDNGMTPRGPRPGACPRTRGQWTDFQKGTPPHSEANRQERGLIAATPCCERTCGARKLN